jgi:hypothetical protein
VVYDFSTGLTQAYQYDDVFDPDPMVLKDGVWCMWAGDLNDDGMVETADYSTIFLPEFYGFIYDVYTITDIDMNGMVEVFDEIVIKQNFYGFVYSPVIYFSQK